MMKVSRWHFAILFLASAVLLAPRGVSAAPRRGPRLGESTPIGRPACWETAPASPLSTLGLENQKDCTDTEEQEEDTCEPLSSDLIARLVPPLRVEGLSTTFLPVKTSISTVTRLRC